MDLKEEVRKLAELQNIDSELYSLRRRKDVEKPEELAALKNEFEATKARLTEYEEKLKTIQLKRKEKELDLGQKEENVRKAQSQLYQLKTNKEYQAKLTEIESLKADVSVLEEDILKILEELDMADKVLQDEKKKLEQEKKEFESQENLIKGEIKDIEAKIKNIEDKKKILADKIDKSILPLYERLVSTRNGLAITPVVSENCGACHMKVTAQTINEIKMYKELVYCESCVRILYIPEDYSW